MQPKPQIQDLKITASMRLSTIQAVLNIISESYVFPEVAKEIRASILKKIKQKEYDHITSAAALCEVVTLHLQEVSQDKHLGLKYSYQPMHPKDIPSNQSDEDRRAYLSLFNFGFDKVERLPGNIGYLKFLKFFEPKIAGEVAISAMNFLANTSAMVIDLRDNTGGSPAMVALISSYFFDEEHVHLNDIYWRIENKTEQYWTLPYVPGKKYVDKEVYILTSQRTFSGAEEFAYNLKNLKRATIIGETTRGGAHPGGFKLVNKHFSVNVPSGRAINPITGTNWEGIGVKPDIEVPEELALKMAQLKLMEGLLMTKPNDYLSSQWKRTIETIQQELKSHNFSNS
jgi:C-terminal processing protease CtpA/Prc